MREQFPGWYPKSPRELSDLWSTALFVPDANVLLHCLRHSLSVRTELLRIFEALGESLWVPHQVGLEFHRNRLEVEFGAEDAYGALVKDQDVIFAKARDRLRQLRAHPVINVQKEIAAIDVFQGDFRRRMEEERATHPREAIAEALERLTKLLGGRIGARWTPDRLHALIKEGHDRYTRKVPPGYQDASKDRTEIDKYGDLVIWKDMIEKAKMEHRPIIFITDDVKEDWWWIHKGRKLGPRPELVEEFQELAGERFHLYELAQFLHFAAERFSEIRAGIQQVEKSLMADEQAKRLQVEIAEIEAAQAKVRLLEDERERVIALLSGSPGAQAADSTDRAALRARLVSINSELDALSRVAPTESTADAGAA